MKMTIMAIVVMFSSPLAAQIITVDDDGPADFNSVQDALAAASSGDEIRVAQGIYKPDQGAGITGGDRTATFQLKNGVALKGGYAGFGGAKASDADIAQYETILSGDLNGNDVGDPYDPSKDDNCYHVVTGSGTDGTAVLDGFTITAGKAHGRGDDDHGAGLYNVSGSPTLSWCRFISNKSASHGGGLYNVSGSPTLTNCTFSENRSGYRGGAAIYNLSGSMMLTDCRFTRNWAIYGSGGGMYNDSASPTMINCVFAGNSRGEEVGGCVYCGGGAIYNDDGSPTLINCTFSGNLSFNTQGGAMRNFGSSSPTLINCTFSANSSNRYGGGIYSDAGSPTMINCILWGNMDRDGIDESAQIHTDTGTAIVDYSCIQGLTGALGGTGNIADDPLFMEPDGPDGIVGTEDDNLRLWPGSACADAGDSLAVPPSIDTDLDGDSRVTNGIVDMGAYEGPKQGFLLSTETIIVPEAGTTTFTVALAIDPCGSVEVTVARERGDLDITVESGGSLSFDSSNYFVGQVVTLGAAEDSDTITGSALILVSSPGLVPFGVTATEGDNEPYPNVLVVDAGAGGANNGSRWADAFNDLQDALAFAAANPEIEEIRVAQGRYRPAGPGGDREATFTIINGLAIRGGYAGFGEPDPDARDVDLYKTILSGDLNGDDAETNLGDSLTEPNRAENSYHVVTGAGTDDTAVLDGFIVTGGNANGSSSPDDRGGGMYCNSSSTVTNCIFTGNSASRGGGGMCCRPNEGKVTSPTLVNCKFIGNIATDGGGVSASDSDPTMVNCTFSGNLAINNGGGQMYESDSVPTLSNCIFIGNSAGQQGGGMFCRFTFRMKLTNCTLSGNSAGSGGGGMYITDASGYVTLTNCVFWSDSPEELFEEDTGTVTVNYCCIQGGWPGVGNIETDPLFADPNNGDCHLLPGSPCIDAGDPNYVSQPDKTDLDGNPRVVDGDNDSNSVVDMGAYEHRIIHVDGDANGANNGSSWHDAYKYVQDALSAATSGDEIWVAQGLYKPDQDSNHPGGTGDQSATFQLINAVALKGGYGGFGQPNPNERDISRYETILSGDLTGNDIDVNDPCDLFTEPTRAENSYHVVSASFVDANTVLDGFTITAGMATRQSDPYDLAARGGGMCCGDQASPTVSRCTFKANAARSGGGMYVFMSRSKPKLVNCRFVANAADKSAGGLRIDDSHISRVTNCTFSANWARWNGGAVWNFDTHPVYVNCIFSANAAGRDGGAIWNVDSSWYTLVNCTLVGNTAGHRGGAIDSDEWPTLTNCIFWASRDSTGTGESAHVRSEHGPPGVNSGGSADVGAKHEPPGVNYCCVQGWTGNWGGTGNTGSDPCFADPGYWDSNGTPGDVNDDCWVDGDYHLLAGSPCIDAGDPNYVPEPDETDLDGNPRVLDGDHNGNSTVDMGVYEFSNTPPVAAAGPDQTAYANCDGTDDVMLDGSGSHDEDDDELSYNWSWTVDGNACDANGVSPTIELPVGEHVITLVVNDGTEDSQPDECIITVIGPIQAEVAILPRLINRHSQAKKMIAVMILPEGVSKNQVSNERFVLYPAGVEAAHQMVVPRATRQTKRTTVICFFKRDAVLSALPDDGRAHLQLGGSLTDGQNCCGTGTAWIRSSSQLERFWWPWQHQQR